MLHFLKRNFGPIETTTNLDSSGNPAEIRAVAADPDSVEGTYFSKTYANETSFGWISNLFKITNTQTSGQEETRDRSQIVSALASLIRSNIERYIHPVFHPELTVKNVISTYGVIYIGFNMSNVPARVGDPYTFDFSGKWMRYRPLVAGNGNWNDHLYFKSITTRARRALSNTETNRQTVVKSTVLDLGRSVQRTSDGSIQTGGRRDWYVDMSCELGFQQIDAATRNMFYLSNFDNVAPTVQLFGNVLSLDGALNNNDYNVILPDNTSDDISLKEYISNGNRWDRQIIHVPPYAVNVSLSLADRTDDTNLNSSGDTVYTTSSRRVRPSVRAIFKLNIRFYPNLMPALEITEGNEGDVYIGNYNSTQRFLLAIPIVIF